jgi:ISXO2-like transposase domain
LGKKAGLILALDLYGMTGAYRAVARSHILANVKIGSAVSTDELKSYAKLARHGYKHGAVNHSAEEWVKDEHHTNGIEGFWSIVKRSIRGTHVHVSRRHLSRELSLGVHPVLNLGS